MDDLLFFIPKKKSHMAKLEDLLKAVNQEWTKNITKEISAL